MQKHVGEIKRDGADFAEVATNLREKAEELKDPRQKGKAGRSLACMTAIAIFRGCRGLSGFASFAKADGAWLERCGVYYGTCRRTPSGIDSNGLMEALGGFFAEKAGILPAARGFAARKRRVFSC
ncbi:MAG: hypothetical protein LBU32_11645 [Clostridiales bacterium]|nr:hypothetical protein [Clostridiales bacterium]